MTYARNVERILTILEYVDSSRGGLSVSEISRKLSIPKSTTHIFVRTLERFGYLNRELGSRRYLIGLKAYALGQGVMKALTLSKLALPHMKQLAERTALTVHLAVLDGDQAMYVQKIGAPGLIKFDTYIGKRTSLHCTAVGKALLAYAPKTFLQHTLSRESFIRHTRNTITSPKALLREVHRIRQRGYAIDDEEEELGVRCVAVGVFDANGGVMAALGVCGTITQIRRDNPASVAALLEQAASNLSVSRLPLEFGSSSHSHATISPAAGQQSSIH